MQYTYSTLGEKLENRLPGSKKLQYCANFVYEDGSLKYILNEEGKLNVGDGSNSYQFFVKDHLGNTWLSVKEDGTVEELNHYYPFGMRMGMANSKSDPNQKYLYNGKEMQDETDWLDYGARMYDAQIGRWHVMDNLSEKYAFTSPYTYAINNPIIFIDPDGNDVKYFFFQTGTRGGLAKTAGYISQAGYARDDYGVTRFETRFYQKGDDNLKSGSNSAEPYVGFDIDLASVGFTSDSRSRSFEEHMNRLGPVSLNAAFVDVAIGDDMYSVELGLGFGGGFGNNSPDEITAISYTMKEAANLNNTFGPGQLSVNVLEKDFDEDGNEIGSVGEIIHNGSDGSINRTGIRVWSTSNSDEIKQFWETLLYQHKKKEAE